MTFDGEGQVEGSMVIGDPTVAEPLGAFAVTGVHDPRTGGLTLVPGLWDAPDHATATFLVEGTYDAATGAFTGDQRINVAACPAGLWDTSF